MPENLPKTPFPQPKVVPSGKQTVAEQPKTPFLSKKGWIVVVLCLLLFLLGTVVPVGSIPILRSLAYAMGYSADEAKDISLLRALLSWNEHSKQVTPEGLDPDEVSVFSAASARGMAQEGGPENSLIDIRAVNSALARRGKAGDKLVGSHYKVGQEDDSQAPKVQIKNTNVAAGTEANSTHPVEVFFGEDASAVARDPKDAFNSSASLKKIANSNIAGAGEDDWFMKMVDKAKRKDVNLEALTKDLEMGTTLARLQDSMEVGKNRAFRDMYYAFLMGNAARRTNVIPLKKTLAAAGFNGAEMPKSVFDSSGFSGVGVDADAVVTDLDNIKVRLRNEEMCEKTALSAGVRINENLKDAKNNIKKLSGSFPKNCDDVAGSTFKSSLGYIQAQCKAVTEDYGQLDTFCGVKLKQQGEPCTTVTLTSAYEDYSSYCENACTGIEDPAALETCLKERKTGEQHIGEEFNGKKIDELVEDSFESGFFPEQDWSNFVLF